MTINRERSHLNRIGRVKTNQTSVHEQKLRGKNNILLIMTGALALGCSSGSNFSGSSAKKADQKKVAADTADAGSEKESTKNTGKDSDKNEKKDLEKSSSGETSDAAKGKDGEAGTDSEQVMVKQLPPPEKCDPASGATFANLLSPLVVLGTSNAEVVYEISITDCAGKVKNINAEVISFDFDGEMGGVGLGAVLQYRLVAEGVTHSGVLEARDGQDLFGNKGPDFYHFVTSQKVSTTTKSSGVRLAISLVNKEVKPRGGLPGGAVGEFKIKTFLKFGTAVPVTKEVTFRPFGSK